MTKTRESSKQLTKLQEKQIDCLMEEYRAIYSLALYRLNSLDRRAPITGAALSASLASTAAIPEPATMVIFLGLPLVLVWFLRTTINHARSFEDALRRIEQIEGEANRLLGEETISFQSRHPSKGREVGGRTGRETIGAVLTIVIALLVGTGGMFAQTAGSPWQAQLAYHGFLGVVLTYVILILVRLRGYVYQPQK